MKSIFKLSFLSFFALSISSCKTQQSIEADVNSMEVQGQGSVYSIGFADKIYSEKPNSKNIKSWEDINIVVKRCMLGQSISKCENLETVKEFSLLEFHADFKQRAMNFLNKNKDIIRESEKRYIGKFMFPKADDFDKFQAASNLADKISQKLYSVIASDKVNAFTPKQFIGAFAPLHPVVSEILNIKYDEQDFNSTREVYLVSNYTYKGMECVQEERSGEITGFQGFNGDCVKDGKIYFFEYWKKSRESKIRFSSCTLIDDKQRKCDLKTVKYKLPQNTKNPTDFIKNELDSI